MERGNRKIDREEDRSQVKLYKTRHGWVSCLTRFFHLLSFGAKSEVRAEQFVNPDDLKGHVNGSTESYLKGMSVLGATMLGIGGAAAVAPTTVHAATETAGDQGSVVLGSASQASASTSQSTSLSQDSGSTSGSTSNASTSGSTSAASNSSSTSGQQSNSGSLTSGSTSQASTSGSMNSESAAQISASESTSASAATNSLSIATSTSVATSALNSTSAAKANTIAALNGIVALAANTTNSTTVSTADELRKAMLDTSITDIYLSNDITLNSAITLTNMNRVVTIHGNGHYINAANYADGGIFINNDSRYSADITIENATLYNQSQLGFAHMNGWGTDTVTYRDVTAFGGTLVWTQTHLGVKTLNIAGTTTFNSVP